MKKSLLFSAMALSLGLLSCNQEDMSDVETVTGTPVTVSVEVPGVLSGSESRTLPAAPADHKLRCIMVVDYNTAADVRMEQVAGETMVNEKFRFTFTPAEEDYTCLFWADYVDEGAVASDGKYTDKYYNTADLTNVTYKVSDNTVFNNPACDAFFGKSLAGSPNAVLKRPFVKLSFKDKNHETVQAASSLSVTYTVPSGFSVKDNTVSGSSNQEIKLTAAVPADKDNDIWFYNYVFAPENVNKLPGDILMTVGEDDVMIKTASLVLTQNYDITASIDFASGEGNVDVDVDIDDEYNDPDAPKVGQFMQKDGTFSDIYSAENSIAIVFAAGLKGGDVATNYRQPDGTKIWGYAMGLSSVKRAALTTAETPLDLTSYGIASPWASDDYNGYVYTQQLETATASLGTELMPAYNEWKTANSVAEITNVSDWYIPSARQLLDVMGMTLGYAGGEGIDAVAQNEQFASLLADLMNEGKSSWFGTHTSASNVMSSSVNTGGQIMAVQTSYADGKETILKAFGVNVNEKASTFAIRPVLTIFKPAE
ncbi:DUF6562 domain-containing protein [Phocaeicola plebeius]|uniref:DUF6562 domain-containing protein n=1 Tax=Phocaeicola plebeius TaxID=310297 RepID=UPI0020139A2B|nr:hypothetical protein [Phocaeicola plebeius]MCL1613009.1 hypothetical protein [Phocaeicola plebeius]